MATMTVVYNTPENKAFFEQHYFEVHVPLAKQLPGLLKYEISKGPVQSTTGHDGIYRVAHLHFDSFEAMMHAFGSDIGQQCAADRKILAGDEAVQIYFYDCAAL